MKASQVTIGKSSRPVRLAYLIQNRDDIHRAVLLNTHVWGGATNVLVPAPPLVEVVEVVTALAAFRPDVLVCTDPIVDTRIEQLAETYPGHLLMVSDESIRKHAVGEDLLTIRHRPIPHAAQVLQEAANNQHEKPDVVIGDVEDGRALQPSLLLGAVCDKYSELLKHYFNVRRTAVPVKGAAAIRLAVVTGSTSTPLSITRLHLKQTWSMQLFSNAQDPLTGFGSDSERVLMIFLDDGRGVRVPCSFWNSRRFARRENRHFVAIEDFRVEVADMAALIAEAHNLAEIVMIAETSEETATELRTNMADALTSLNCKARIAVYYGNTGSGIVPGRSHWGVKEFETRSVGADGRIRFSPATPSVLPRAGLLYGFDADLSIDGRKLDLPSSDATTLLLQNAHDQIVAARRNEEPTAHHLLNRIPDLRAQPEGVAGLTVAGAETVLHVHRDSDIVVALLEDSGIRAAGTGHSRAASAFIDRLGSVASACRFYRDGGFHLLRALTAHRAHAGGSTFRDIQSYLGSGARLPTSTAKHLLDHWLDRLLSTALVRRGVALRCDVCDLETWYALDSLRDPLSCAGCGEFHTLSNTQMQISFRANELISRLVREGGEALFMTASALRESDNRSLLMFGADLYSLAASEHLGEVDLIAATPSGLVFAECKAWNDIGPDHLIRIERSLERTITAASAAKCREVVLGIRTSSPVAPLYDIVRNASAELTGQVDVTLLCNGSIYVDSSTSVEPIKTTFNPPPRPPAALFVGPPSSGASSGSINPLFSAALRNGWLDELTKTIP